MNASLLLELFGQFKLGVGDPALARHVGECDGAFIRRGAALRRRCAWLGNGAAASKQQRTQHHQTD